MTWKELTTPDYVMAFVEGFLLGGLPMLGAGNVADQAITNAGSINLAQIPSAIPILVSVAYGTLNGIRFVRQLSRPSPTTPPATNGSSTPVPVPAPKPAGGG